MMSGTVFKPLTQLIIAANTQLQLKTQLPNPMDKPRFQFVILIITLTTLISYHHPLLITCTDWQ